MLKGTILGLGWGGVAVCFLCFLCPFMTPVLFSPRLCKTFTKHPRAQCHSQAQSRSCNVEFASNSQQISAILIGHMSKEVDAGTGFLHTHTDRIAHGFGDFDFEVQRDTCERLLFTNHFQRTLFVHSETEIPQYIKDM